MKHIANRSSCRTGVAVLATAALIAAMGINAPALLAAPANAPTKATSATDQPKAVATDAGATQKPQAHQVQAEIKHVRGIVQYRTAADQPWQKVTEGLKLDVGVEFRTGPRSSVTFFLPPDQLVTLDRLGTLKLLDAVNNPKGDEAKTDLGMPYGRARYQVQGAMGVEHDATIVSPSATLAIRGTEDVTLNDQQPGPASASSRGSRVYFQSRFHRNRVVFGSRNNPNNQSVDEGDSGPAQHRRKKRALNQQTGQNGNGDSDESMIEEYELYQGRQLIQQKILRIRKRPATSQPSHDGDGYHYDD